MGSSKNGLFSIKTLKCLFSTNNMSYSSKEFLAGSSSSFLNERANYLLIFQNVG